MSFLGDSLEEAGFESVGVDFAGSPPPDAARGAASGGLGFDASPRLAFLARDALSRLWPRAEPFSSDVPVAPTGLRQLRARQGAGGLLGGDGLRRRGRGPDLGGPVGGRRGRRDLVDAGAGADPGGEDRGAGGGLPPPAGRWSENIGSCDAQRAAAGRRQRRASSAPRRNFTNAGNGSSPATREARRSRTDGRVSSSRSSPAASASRRQPWQCERWRASRRVSRVPSRVCAAVTMMSWMRRQRAPETMSSYSSVSRRRARKSVDSTAGRLMPMRWPICW